MTHIPRTLHSFERTACLLLLLPFAGCAAGDPEGAAGDIIQTAHHDFRVEEVADGLVRPFSMVFTPEGDLLVTERPGGSASSGMASSCPIPWRVCLRSGRWAAARAP